MWTTVAKDIEQKTQQYWRVCQAWNCRGEDSMATGEAIAICKDNLCYTNPARPIYHQSSSVLKEIVAGEASQRLVPATIHILPSAAMGV